MPITCETKVDLFLLVLQAIERAEPVRFSGLCDGL